MATRPHRYIQPADMHIARRLKLARNRSKLSLERACEIVNVTHWQISKYESGRNRISAGRLLTFANAYGVPIQWFYEGAPA